MAVPVFNPANATMNAIHGGQVPVEQGKAIIGDIMANSLMMQLATYEEMTAPTKVFDVYLGGVGAYWVDEGERIQTSKPTWTQATMRAKKLGVIIPVSREYLSYTQADFFDFVRPLVAEAFYKKFDAATFLDVDNPFNFSIEDSLTASGKSVLGDINVMNLANVLGQLNADGYEPNAIISKTANIPDLRALMGVQGPLYDPANKTLDGIKVFDMNRSHTAMLRGTLYAGDFNLVRYGIPYNMNFAISTDAQLSTVVDAGGVPLNLFEREMAALRVTMDVAFMVIDDNAFAALKPIVVPVGSPLYFLATQTTGVEDVTTTTAIGISLSKSATITADNIEIIDLTGKATKGAVTGSASTYSVAVSGVEQGTVRVKLKDIEGHHAIPADGIVVPVYKQA